MNFSIHPSFMWSLFISALEVLGCNLQRHLKVGNNTAGHKKILSMTVDKFLLLCGIF